MLVMKELTVKRKQYTLLTKLQNLSLVIQTEKYQNQLTVIFRRMFCIKNNTGSKSTSVVKIKFIGRKHS